jgi:hypothetical protein
MYNGMYIMIENLVRLVNIIYEIVRNFAVCLYRARNLRYINYILKLT